MDAKGKKYYVKFYSNPDQARVEELAGKLFNIMGVETPGAKFREVNDKQALVTPWNEDLKRIPRDDFSKLNTQQQGQLASMYHAAVLTKNWDVLGLEWDNVVVNTKTENLVEVDTGGSFNFRAQGANKPYGEDIGELKSLLDPGKAAGEVFGTTFKLNPAVELKSVEKLKNMNMEAVNKAFMSSGLSNAAELHRVFLARRNLLLAHYQS